jgi:predicted AlkP superfamily phosphohydrolase/phosphomutase
MALRSLPLLIAAFAASAFLLVDALGGALPARAPAPAPDATTRPRVVVLGFDGVDERILRAYMEAQELPHLRALAAEGGFQPLESELPPESPVAWASMLTGVNPGRHGIHDFVTPGHDFTPENGMVTVTPMRLLAGRLILRPPMARSRLAAPTFLERVHDAGYPVLSLRQPHLFPAPNRPGSRWLAGLGVPDVSGSVGAATTWSARPGFAALLSEFGGTQIPLRGGTRAARYESTLPGPLDPTLPRGRDGMLGRAEVPVAFDVERAADGTAQAVTLTLAGRAQRLEAGQRSAFYAVTFRLGTLPAVEVAGLVRVEVKSLDPLTVLADPVNIDPRRALLALSSPSDYGAELFDRYGPFETIGWQEQTFSLNDYRQDDDAFLADALDDMRRGAALLMGEIRGGARCVFQCFTATDRVAHAFFRLRDVDHPRHDTKLRQRLGDPILEAYRVMDEIVGAVRAQLAPEDLLLVVSDHGFATWRYGMNVNQWLLDEGYLTLAGTMGQKDLNQLFQRGDLGVDVVDWPRTRAVAIGLGQVFLNVKGERPQGCVDPGEVPGLVEELRTKLLAVRNPHVPEDQPIRQVVALHSRYRGPTAHEAGHLQLCFAEGYRVSWQTALLGGFHGRVFEQNVLPWSGDHCSTDPAVVPGIVLSNRRLAPAPPDRPYHVRDVAATVLKSFGLAIDDLDGLPFAWRPEAGR